MKLCVLSFFSLRATLKLKYGKSLAGQILLFPDCVERLDLGIQRLKILIIYIIDVRESIKKLLRKDKVLLNTTEQNLGWVISFQCSRVLLLVFLNRLYNPSEKVVPRVIIVIVILIFIIVAVVMIPNTHRCGLDAGEAFESMNATKSMAVSSMTIILPYIKS